MALQTLSGATPQWDILCRPGTSLEGGIELWRQRLAKIDGCQNRTRLISLVVNPVWKHAGSFYIINPLTHFKFGNHLLNKKRSRAVAPGRFLYFNIESLSYKYHRKFVQIILWQKNDHILTHQSAHKLVLR